MNHFLQSSWNFSLTIISLLEEETAELYRIHREFYRSFHGFGQAKFPDGGLDVGLNQFSMLPQLHQKAMLASKGVKIDSIVNLIL